VDIGIPRTVDPCLGDRPACRLRNIDALNGLVEGNLLRREEESRKGEAIVREEAAEAMRWIETRRNASLIKGLAEYMESIRARELQRVCRQENLSEGEKLERLSTHIVKKITQPLIKKINEARVEGDQTALKGYLELLREVYRV
jgi:glutamyl-tRNA reductase